MKTRYLIGKLYFGPAGLIAAIVVHGSLAFAEILNKQFETPKLKFMSTENTIRKSKYQTIWTPTTTIQISQFGSGVSSIESWNKNLRIERYGSVGARYRFIRVTKAEPNGYILLRFEAGKKGTYELRDAKFIPHKIMYSALACETDLVKSKAISQLFGYPNQELIDEISMSEGIEKSCKTLPANARNKLWRAIIRAGKTISNTKSKIMSCLLDIDPSKEHKIRSSFSDFLNGDKGRAIGCGKLNPPITGSFNSKTGGAILDPENELCTEEAIANKLFEETSHGAFPLDENDAHKLRDCCVDGRQSSCGDKIAEPIEVLLKALPTPNIVRHLKGKIHAQSKELREVEIQIEEVNSDIAKLFDKFRMDFPECKEGGRADDKFCEQPLSNEIQSYEGKWLAKRCDSERECGIENFTKVVGNEALGKFRKAKPSDISFRGVAATTDEIEVIFHTTGTKIPSVDIDPPIAETAFVAKGGQIATFAADPAEKSIEFEKQTLALGRSELEIGSQFYNEGFLNQLRPIAASRGTGQKISEVATTIGANLGSDSASTVEANRHSLAYVAAQAAVYPSYSKFTHEQKTQVPASERLVPQSKFNVALGAGTPFERSDRDHQATLTVPNVVGTSSNLDRAQSRNSADGPFEGTEGSKKTNENSSFSAVGEAHTSNSTAARLAPKENQSSTIVPVANRLPTSVQIVSEKARPSLSPFVLKALNDSLINGVWNDDFNTPSGQQFLENKNIAINIGTKAIGEIKNPRRTFKLVRDKIVELFPKSKSAKKRAK